MEAKDGRAVAAAHPVCLSGSAGPAKLDGNQEKSVEHFTTLNRIVGICESFRPMVILRRKRIVLITLTAVSASK